jgi:hypothetical protein
MKSIRSGRAYSLGASLVLLLAGCVSLPLSADRQLVFCRSIDMALEQSPAALRKSADAGDGHAQLALSIVQTYGLNGEPVDSTAAVYNRGRALASRGSTTTAIYVPGYLKVPGHTQLISIPVTDVSEIEDRAVAACVAVLASPGNDARARIAKGVCGGAENYRRLSAGWANAKSQR